jgi:uncharacterized protein (TIGR02266 family)
MRTMKLPVKITSRHRGKSLEVSSESETVALIGPTGDKEGEVSLETVIDLIQTCIEEERPKRLRNYPRLPLAVKVTYQAPGSNHVEALTGEIGGGGVFIESPAPLPEGTEITMDLVLPDDPAGPIRAKGKVAWVRSRQERYVFFPGMGVQFTEIPEKARDQLVEIVKSLDHVRRSR